MEHKLTVYITDRQYEQVCNLPRGFNVSEKVRECLDVVLATFQDVPQKQNDSILDKHLPEVVAIEKGDITFTSTDEVKQRLAQAIKQPGAPKQTKSGMQSTVCICGHTLLNHDVADGCLADGGLCDCKQFREMK